MKIILSIQTHLCCVESFWYSLIVTKYYFIFPAFNFNFRIRNLKWNWQNLALKSWNLRTLDFYYLSAGRLRDTISGLHYNNFIKINLHIIMVSFMMGFRSPASPGLLGYLLYAKKKKNSRKGLNPCLAIMTSFVSGAKGVYLFCTFYALLNSSQKSLIMPKKMITKMDSRKW